MAKPPSTSDARGLAARPANETTLAERLFLALLTPILMLVITGVVLGAQILRMVDAADWVDHTDEAIALLDNLDRSILEQESSVRGYLLGDDERLLDPFLNARPKLMVEDLRKHTLDNPFQTARMSEIVARYENWYESTRRDLEKKDKSANALRERSLKMNDIRSKINDAIEHERALLLERSAASKTSYTTTIWLFVTLLLATGGGIAFFSRRQLGAIAGAYGSALAAERDARDAVEEEGWIRAAIANVSDAVRGELATSEVGKRALKELAESTGADVGAFYASAPNGWERVASHALDTKKAGSKQFERGVGLIGQAAADAEFLLLTDLPDDYLAIRSGTGSKKPAAVIIAPALVEGQVGAVVELAFLKQPKERAIELVRRIGENVATATRSAQYRARLQELLDETQRQAEELQTQQEELRVSNEELEEQGNMLRKAQVSLEEQQHELEATNANLEEQAEALSRQKAELVDAQRGITEKAAELERSNRYKSEFLANMSHELRTPLNSTLILAKLLSDDKHGTLTEEQLQFARTIYSAGNDLLTLINDVLDLSKIEAGKVEVNSGIVGIRQLADGLARMFSPVASSKNVAFRIVVAEGIPDSIDTDSQRVEQILKNLLSNAFKFTESGEVELRFAKGVTGLSISVKDTGIGVPRDKQIAVFEAFRQADGTTARKYGGTGLGLSISRELASLLGGELSLTSEPGKGSTFTLTLPTKYQGPSAPPRAPVMNLVDPPTPTPSSTSTWQPTPAAAQVMAGAIEDDRAAIDGVARVLLVIEDDVRFGKILYDLARELDFKCVVATTADEGFELAKRFVPSAIVLDLNLPDHPGLSVLDRLKHTSATRHIPVHVLSVEDRSKTALSMGAVGSALKPAKREELIGVLERLERTFSRGVKRILVVEDDDVQRQSVRALLSGEGIEVIGAATVAQALEQLSSQTFDCVVTDLALPDGSGSTLLETMAKDERYAFPPVIVYTGRTLTSEEEQHLGRLSNSIIVKGARSPERLLDEVTLFLHQVESRLPPERQRMLRAARDREAAFEDRNILVVEDDVRNVFALSSVLEPRGAHVVIARNGREALEKLEKEKIDLVLMDVMMPEMDGLEATRQIRGRSGWQKLPIIALTAKAMRDDQEKCLAAGANDYLAKPIDIEKLLSLVRVWMPK